MSLTINLRLKKKNLFVFCFFLENLNTGPTDAKRGNSSGHKCGWMQISDPVGG